MPQGATSASTNFANLPYAVPRTTAITMDCAKGSRIFTQEFLRLHFDGVLTSCLTACNARNRTPSSGESDQCATITLHCEYRTYLPFEVARRLAVPSPPLKHLCNLTLTSISRYVRLYHLQLIQNRADKSRTCFISPSQAERHTVRRLLVDWFILYNTSFMISIW